MAQPAGLPSFELKDLLKEIQELEKSKKLDMQPIKLEHAITNDDISRHYFGRTGVKLEVLQKLHDQLSRRPGSMAQKANNAFQEVNVDLSYLYRGGHVEPDLRPLVIPPQFRKAIQRQEQRVPYDYTKLEPTSRTPVGNGFIFEYQVVVNGVTRQLNQLATEMTKGDLRNEVRMEFGEELS